MQRISYGEIKNIIKKEFTQYTPERVRLCDALGRIAAEDLISSSELPPHDVSEKDGFAVNHSSILHASNTSPVVLKVTQLIRPDTIPTPLQEGTCARIFTGSRVPEGADSVVMQEDVIEKPDGIFFSSPIKPWSNIFRKGSDIIKGEKIVARGNLLGPYQLSILSSFDIVEVNVLRKLNVAVLSTGNELVSQNKEKIPGKIPDTNKPVLMNILSKAGFVPVDAGIAADDVEVIKSRVKKFISISDAIIVTGGSSVGGYDLTTTSFDKLGAKILFHGVRLRPSSTAGVASLFGKPAFLLSGLIQSSLVALFLIAIPTLRYIQGLDFQFLKVVEARITKELTIDLPRNFFRAVWVKVEAKRGILEAEPTLVSSHSRSVVIRNNGIMLVKGGKKLRKGQRVKIYLVADLM